MIKVKFLNPLNIHWDHSTVRSYLSIQYLSSVQATSLTDTQFSFLLFLSKYYLKVQMMIEEL